MIVTDNIISETIVKTESMNQLIDSRSNHNRDDFHICCICNKQFPSGKSLDEHILIHTDAIRQISRATGVHIPLPNLQENETLTFYSSSDKCETFTQLPTGHTMILDQSALCHSQEKGTSVNFQEHLPEGDRDEPATKRYISQQQTAGPVNNVTVMKNNPTDIFFSSGWEAKHRKGNETNIVSDAENIKTTQQMFTPSDRSKKKTRLESRNGMHTCSVCDQKFKNSGHLKDHSRVHTGERPYCCRICKKYFTQKCNMKRHMIFHEKHGENKILILEKRASKKSENSSVSHCFSNKNVKHTINASQDASDNRIASFSVIHNEENVDSEDDTCVDFEGMTLVNGTDNIQTEHYSDQSEKSVDETGNKPVIFNNSENCFTTDNADQQRNPTDQFINTSIKDEQDIETVNANSNEINKQLQSTDSLQSESHTVAENVMQIAHRSDKQFDKIDAVDLHIHDHAREETGFSDNYHEKFEVKCSNENTCACDHCNKQFKSPEHRAFHSDKDRCSQSAKLQFSYRNKNRTYFGNGKRLHTCTVCNRKFKSSGHLKEHIRIHTGERPFCCSICDKPFTSVSNMKRHRLIHEKTEVNETKLLAIRASDHSGNLTMSVNNHSTKVQFNLTDSNPANLVNFRQSEHQLDIVHEKHVNLNVKSEFDHYTAIFQQTNKNKPLVAPSSQDSDISSYKQGESQDTGNLHYANGKRLHTCTVCNRKFRNSGHLKVHIRIHTGERPFCCSICDKSFTSMSNMKRHRLIHEKTEVNETKLLAKRASDHSGNLTMSVNNHSSKVQFNSTDSNPASFVNLRQSEHQIDIIHEKHVNLSGRSEFVHSTARIQQTNTNKPSVAPSRQDDTSYKQGDGQDIGKLHFFRKKISKLYTCDICGRKGIKYRWAHMRSHSEKSHPCPVCGKLFRKKGDVTTHLAIHTKQKPYACEICGKQQAQLASLRKHLLVHTDEKHFICEICGKRFKGECSLRSHIGLHNLSEEMQCTCDLCNKSFANKDRLRFHITYTHFKEKTHRCTFCSKTFKFSSNLNSHMAIHLNEKSHECEVCKKRFIDMGSFRKHMFSHSGEQPYSCKQCNKHFKRAENLRTHMLIHDGKKPHSCSICGKNFRQKGSVKIHIMRVHDKP